MLRPSSYNIQSVAVVADCKHAATSRNYPPRTHLEHRRQDGGAVAHGSSQQLELRAVAKKVERASGCPVITAATATTAPTPASPVKPKELSLDSGRHSSIV